VQSTGAFTSAFVLAGAVAIAGVTCVLIFVRPIAVTPESAKSATSIA
jgi:ACS family hexuronate transporter-like MFS transporter